MRQSRRMTLIAGLAVLCLAAVLPARAAPVRIYAAGSLSGAMQALITESGLPASAFAEPVFGPAGLLRDRLTSGETADLFASADVQQPSRVATSAPDRHGLLVPFARNRMCLASRATLGITPANMLDKLLDPSIRLATSTPGADPGGDYALAVFGKAEILRPGAAATLTAKAAHLLGAPNAMTPVAGHSPAASIFLGDAADALLYYCSGSAALLREVDGLANLPLPDTLEVNPLYAMLVTTDNPDAARFGLFIMSDQGQAVLARFGFLPLVSSAP